MAGIWYRRGTVSLTNGSAVVNGAGVTWNDPAGGVQVGNIFFGPDGKAYEVAYVLSATRLQLASNYGGPTATAQPYAIVTPIVGSIPALSTKVAAVLGYAQGQYDSWQRILTGTGDVTLTAPDGTTITVPSINGIAENKLDKTGTAAAATKLATARTIGGVSFDGSDSINLPGVNVAGNQPTSGNAATATKLETARTITIGNTGKTFDGTANQSWSLSEIGAAALTGATFTGSVLCTPVESGADCNTHLLAGFYNINASSLNWAWGANGGSMIVSRHGNYVNQIAAQGSDGRLAVRQRVGNDSSWTPWKAILRDGDALPLTGGTLTGTLTGTSATFAGTVTPTTDNVRTLGTASLRWSTLYAGTGTINTSDAREKTAVTPFSAAEVAAAIDICNNIGSYQWLESIEKKTEDGARHHVGLTVQRAMEIMQEHGLDPFRYGFICYDEWEAEYRDVDDEAGDLVRTVERQVTRAEERTTTEIKVVDGVPTQVTTITTELVPVYEDRAVVDEAGNPVLVNHPAEVVHHPAELDEDGAVITEAWDEVIRESYSTALTHPVPVMESVEVRYRRDVVREAGDRYSFRMDQLALFCLCGIAQSS